MKRYNIDVCFDYNQPAELFTGKCRRAGPGFLTYHRFATAAEAIRFAIEDLPAARLRSAIIEVSTNRFRHMEIRKLYDNRRYPLARY